MSDENKHPCGPWEGGINVLVPQEPFRDACLLHDEHYTHPGEMSRAEADRIFLEGMLKAARNPWQRLKAYAFYASVRAFGWRYFQGKA